MRGEEVDERDAMWERTDARYRVFVYQGEGRTVAVTDIVEATLHDVFEAARPLSNGDRDLWSLALVVDDADGRRGLIWLSGLDYHATPGTREEWRLRAEMENRYLRARVQRGEPALLPDGRRVVRMFPEWVSGWPLWEDFTGNYRLDASSLEISTSLGDDLNQWNQQWLSRREYEPLADPDGWRAEGIRLLERLRTELDGIAHIRPDFL